MSQDELVKFRLHNMSMVFQSFAPMPHMTVVENAAFGLELANISKPKRIERAMQALDQVGLKGWESCYPKESQQPAADRMTVSGIEGAVTDPIKLGFVVSDIRIVANKKFIKENPAAQKFFEVFTLPLNDINAQNTLMNEGQKSQKDIERHAANGISKNQSKWNRWLEAARQAAQ